MSRRDTRTQPRALSEADELDLYLEKRDTWLSTEVRSSARQLILSNHASPMARLQQPVRPDAPWLQFLDGRYPLLLAYQAVERARQAEGPTSDSLDPLRKSFLHLTRELDRITIPVEYWSDRPHEALEGEGRHVRPVEGLAKLASAFAERSSSGRVDDTASAQRIMTELILQLGDPALGCDSLGCSDLDSSGQGLAGKEEDQSWV
ncbi:hypothetical protein BMF94_6263 [Rhodotorula taiwanensis]|uniref:Uncharacterized protein n=1 Tax=Rhodotorula taiwanensis TaxID=741276 RepID=A0A2S5B255_9BASI|nr:hypothetical protein BMF94_6263 [Rhodotorula taiwanensis]